MSGGLRVAGLGVWAGAFQVLHGIDLEVPAGGALAMVGPNGAGKSLLLRGIMGLAPARGAVTVDGQDLSGAPVRRRLLAGLALCPGERALFPEMSVGESLRMGAYLRRDGEVDADLEHVRARVPRLAERWRTAAGRLSGGEQRMLAVASALMARPAFLLLDEPSAGLSPEPMRLLAQLIRDGPLGRRPGLLVAEQNLEFATSLCESVAVLRRGRICGRHAAAEVRRDAEVRHRVRQLM
ncbi:MAG TPA: ATP-binding cassette domain-containing protein [Longimicrobium sp.]|nr:ATP-binding cassette domain-containing protein [Longimicrobium sp.]